MNSSAYQLFETAYQFIAQYKTTAFTNHNERRDAYKAYLTSTACTDIELALDMYLEACYEYSVDTFWD